MEQVNNITSIAGMITVLGGIAMTGLHYVIVMPLKSVIERLSDTVERLEKTVANMEAQQHELDKRITVVEQSAKAAHRRLDEMRDDMR